MGMQQFRKLVVEFVQRLQPLRRTLYNLRLCLKDPPSVFFDKQAHDLAHSPARRAEDLQTIHTWHKERNAVVAHHTNTLGKTFKSL